MLARLPKVEKSVRLLLNLFRTPFPLFLKVSISLVICSRWVVASLPWSITSLTFGSTFLLLSLNSLANSVTSLTIVFISSILLIKLSLEFLSVSLLTSSTTCKASL
ncbi:hypothetical protein I7640_00025 [Mycoplasma mycoides subsp. capri]|nr:hypothetical protein I7640_00025 [Mycoplasma mycoides subsp. capri]